MKTQRCYLRKRRGVLCVDVVAECVASRFRAPVGFCSFLQVKSEAVVASGVADEDIVNCVQVCCLTNFLR